MVVWSYPASKNNRNIIFFPESKKTKKIQNKLKSLQIDNKIINTGIDRGEKLFSLTFAGHEALPHSYGRSKDKVRLKVLRNALFKASSKGKKIDYWREPAGATPLTWAIKPFPLVTQCDRLK